MSFFQGTLQEGIGAALQQSKSVVCFVTDGETESQQWEDEFFAEEEIQSLLQSHSVTLRLPAGSQEEGFLAQLYPIPKKPTVVVIKNAELKEYIAAGVSKDEFGRRLKAALTPNQPAASQPQPMAAPAAPLNQPIQVEQSSASSSGRATPPSPNDSQVQLLVAERTARLAEQNKKAGEEAKRQRAEKAKTKAEAVANGSKKPDDQSKHAEALRKKQREAREERQRILKAIEDDKTARKARQEEVKAERRASIVSEKQDSAPFAPASQLLPSTGKLSEHCAIQVRLFDSTTIRNRFSSADTLKDVRQWVDDTRKDGKQPYVFKLLLTPLPSRTIDVTQEGKPLQELELCPSATLILLRVPKYSAAYTSSAGSVAAAQGNVFQRFIAYILSIVTGFFSTIFAFFSTLFSISGPPTAPQPTSSQTSQSQAGADATRRRGGHIAGVGRSDEGRKDQQFYNGNSTNFEPRPDDGE